MRLRRFRGADAAAALRLVKQALGPEAIILATRPCTEGMEITAAVDLDAVAEMGEPQPAVAVPDGLYDGLAEITRELRTLGARVARMEPGAAAPSVPGRRLGCEGRALAERLMLHGLAAPLATRIARGFQKRRASGAAEAVALHASLERHLVVDERDGSRRVDVLVGPTGCGKTTTIAKLAAAAAGDGKTRIGFVMADTYRIGAVEQLEAYARLLGAQMVVAQSAGEVRGALQSLAECDAVYVDTAGVGGDPASVRDLQAVLSGLDVESRVTAVVSAGLSEAAFERAWSRLQPLGPKQCVVTKLDESPGFGAACSWMAGVGMRLRCLGTGQRVPDDLTQASGETLAHWLLAA